MDETLEIRLRGGPFDFLMQEVQAGWLWIDMFDRETPDERHRYKIENDSKIGIYLGRVNGRMPRHPRAAKGD